MIVNFVCILGTIFVINLSPAQGATKIKECKTPPVVPSEIIMGDCVDHPCIAVRGKSLPSEIIFTPDKDYEQLTVVAKGMVAGNAVGYPGVDKKSICNSLVTYPDKEKASCPLKAGQQYAYLLQFPVSKAFIPMTAMFHFALKDKVSKKEVTCGEILMKIV